jgi:hypothetical protein
MDERLSGTRVHSLNFVMLWLMGSGKSAVCVRIVLSLLLANLKISLVGFRKRTPQSREERALYSDSCIVFPNERAIVAWGKEYTDIICTLIIGCRKRTYIRLMNQGAPAKVALKFSRNNK